MWNDEDNNPYGALDRNEDPLGGSFHPAAMAPRKTDLALATLQKQAY